MKKVIIDTDTAGDDTIAILTALHNFDVLGMTITGGNVDFNQQIDNALYSTQVAGKTDIPVYPGYSGPILSGVGKTRVRDQDIQVIKLGLEIPSGETDFNQFKKLMLEEVGK